MNSKTIILGLPNNFDIGNLIKENLSSLGFNIIDVSYPEHISRKFTKKQKRTYKLRKILLNDKNYKSVLKFNPYRSEIERKINEIEQPVDYCLLIRADIYPIDFIQLLKQKSKLLVSYHWDGLHRFPAIKKLIPLFDRFFVFDANDLKTKHQNILPATNFYFDIFDATPVKKEYDLFFMGSCIKSRMPIILNFLNCLKAEALKRKFLIYSSCNKEQNTYKREDIVFFNKHISYKENIELLNKSNIVVDFLNGTHKGLSFRTFEAIQFDKKLITNNPTIVNYDFFHPNNFFYWNGNNNDELIEFCKLPFSPMDEKLKEKYSFSNWISYILNQKGHQAIDLPKTSE